MESHDLHLNIVIYNILIDAFCKDKKLNTVRALFNILSSKGLHPDVKTYTMMIQGLCEEGLLDEAKEFVKIEQNGCLPNDVTYNIVIQGFLGQQKYHEASILLDEMFGRGFSADASTFSLIVDILSTKGQDPALQEVIKKLMPKHTVHTSYAILLDGLCKNGRISKALSLFHVMERNGLDLNVVMYSIIIDAFCKDKKLDTARALFNNLSSNGLHSNVKTYTMMIQRLCKECLLDEAKDLFVKMEQNGCLANDVTHSTIIQRFIGQQKCYEVLVLLDEMIGRGFMPDASTVSLVVDLISTKGQDFALKEMIKKFMAIG
ncbi:hypothetical protein HYC85_000137 [Camellia sinensis]|uniref:Pentacotripeptide-repeat region of PRORP domain-containing protein n=1 Tax=Camellia sinensis TaxID=4442 RepID=A0A7J7I478_CAMSI|nr:hypothetical protein HYC85_000137 [Camellia sinensis]